MEERGNFYNDGSGWICRPCENELRTNELSNAAREGEANPALAKWTDATRRFLTCPRCGITEPAEIS